MYLLFAITLKKIITKIKKNIYKNEMKIKKWKKIFEM